MKSKKSRSGFTLMELLVAMTIFSIVMTAIYSAFNIGARVWKRGETDMQVFQDARVALALMAKELRCAFPDAGHLFYGEDERSGERDTDRIEFYTVRPPLDLDKGQEAAILKVAYYVDAARGRRAYVLKREEQVVEGRIPTEEELDDKEAREKDIEMEKPWECIVASRVRSLNIEYSWVEEWIPRCEKGFGLPVSIRITLTLESEDKKAPERRFETGVYIPLEHGSGPPRENEDED